MDVGREHKMLIRHAGETSWPQNGGQGGVETRLQGGYFRRWPHKDSEFKQTWDGGRGGGVYSQQERIPKIISMNADQ